MGSPGASPKPSPSPSRATCPSTTRTPPPSRSTHQAFIEKLEFLTIVIQNLRIFPNSFKSDEWYQLDIRVSFDFDHPFTVDYSAEVGLLQFNFREARMLHFALIVLLGCALILVSSVLLWAAYNVCRNIFKISTAIKTAGGFHHSQKAIILDYNHCRFIDSDAIISKASPSGQTTFWEFLGCFRVTFYLSILSYVINVMVGFYAIIDILDDGIVGKGQFYLLSVSIILSTADISTVFSKNSQYNLVYVLIKKNSKKLLMFLLGVALVFATFTLVLFQFLKEVPRFETIRDCFHIILGLSQADSVKDLFDASRPRAFGIVLIFLAVWITFLTCNQILVALVTVGFQKTKDAFYMAAEEKAERMEQLNELTQRNYKRFDYQLRLKKQLLEELRLIFQRDFFADEKDSPDLLVRRPSGEDGILDSLRKTQSINPGKPKKRKTSLHEPAFTQKISTKDDNSLSYGAPLRSQGQLPRDDGEEVEVERHLAVFRNLCVELVVQSYFNFDLLKNFFEHFQIFRRKNLFSFVQIIALWDLCEDYLEKLKQMEMRILRLQNKIRLH